MMYPSPPLFGHPQRPDGAIDDLVKVDGVYMTRGQASAYQAQIYPYTAKIENDTGGKQ